MSKIKKCILCNSINLKNVISIGNVPPVNQLTSRPGLKIKSVLANLLFCKKCGHGQQEYQFDEKKIFKNYKYVSGTTNTLNKFFKEFAHIINNSFDKNDNILELACNDGTFLEYLNKKKLNIFAVDPAKNILPNKIKKNIKFFNNFWPIKNFNKNFKLIIGFNVLAHCKSPLHFFQESVKHLDDDGVLILQTSQVNMFKNFEFDTIYHEHYSFFTKQSMEFLGNKFKLKYKLFQTNIHGDSLLAIFYKVKNRRSEKVLNNINKAKIKRLIQKKININEFQKQAIKIKNKILFISKKYKEKSHKIIFVGAAAKTITFMYYTKLKPDFIIDESNLKIGKYVPNTKIKIRSFKFIKKISNDCLFIVGAWNFFEEIHKKIKKLRYKNKNDKFVKYFPKYKLR